MRIAQLQRPIAAAASSVTRTTATTTIRQLRESLGQLRIGASNIAVEGRRHATHQSQGSYRLKDTSTLPKKLGAKKSGDSYVIPGNIIYKQRGTIWFPGENCGMGRDHTIFALATGYVKYYRDPAKHPKRQYIGVVFDKADKLPYHPHAMRKRRLNMVSVPLVAPTPQPELSPSGIPTQVVRQGLGRKPHPRDERVMKLRTDGSYAYAEESWRLGTLVRTEKRKMGSRRVAMRHRRRKAKAIALEMRAEREDKIARRKEALDAQRKARARKMREYRERKKAEAEAKEGAAGGGGGGAVPPPPTTTSEPPRVDA
ncbi:ribosomal L27 protein-domain-containing protein [Annulohypoxylon maeteangense]|uniref:ribosomal L27 protein-domain-containing protein n=1 Tax=Annulohypoxylon maeteangense TaxID=1927788 RepID=UPI002008749F|nr:ribosomal L27 protein-domain-containing protein [Annulohypoxylon maeteangense]KAI0883124.1 ribosomal L27 protein-domain-containing protein [Annulohypoxylon maeteangense]